MRWPPATTPASRPWTTRSRPGGRRFRLLAGLDRDKDQSYFLYGLQQEQLAHTRFPLGALAASRRCATWLAATAW